MIFLELLKTDHKLLMQDFKLVSQFPQIPLSLLITNICAGNDNDCLKFTCKISFVTTHSLWDDLSVYNSNSIRSTFRLAPSRAFGSRDSLGPHLFHILTTKVKICTELSNSFYASKIFTYLQLGVIFVLESHVEKSGTVSLSPVGATNQSE